MKKSLFIMSNATLCGGGEKNIEILYSHLSQKYNVFIFLENFKHYQNLRHRDVPQSNIIKLKGGRYISLVYNLLKIIIFYYKIKPENILCNTNKGALYWTLINKFLPTKKNRIFVYIRDFSWICRSFIFNNLNAEYLVPNRSLLDFPQYIPSSIRTKLNVVPNPIDIVDSKTKIEEKDFIFFPVSYNRWKGIDFAIRALAKCNRANTNLVIVGPTVSLDYKKELIDLIHSHNLSQNVILKDYCADLKKYYANCLFVINTSISKYGGPETFGRTIIEAWSYKKAVISFDCGGPKYLISHQVNGLLVPERNTQELTTALSELIHNQDLRKKMGENGYLKCMQNFTPAKISEELINNHFQ
jgi:glycosyltransferase involved in cell wall biosynthesis